MKNNYALKWILQRITALVLIPLTFWFIYKCISFQDLQHQEIKLFFESYLNGLFFLVMMIAMLIHAKLGCDTIVQDYVSSQKLHKTFKAFINIIVLITLLLALGSIIKLSII